MTGVELRRATLTSASGRQLAMVVRRPSYTLVNVGQLKAAEVAWRAQAEALPLGSEERFRAEFASTVAFYAARSLGRAAREPADFLVVVGTDEATDEVLGAQIAYWSADGQAWYMAVGATRPADQPGYPNPDQVRGIGLELVGALVAVMNSIRCARVTLEPLDAAAERFWSARGFHHDSADEMAMTCPESQELAARLAHSERDDPARGDAPFFKLARPVL